MKWQADRAGRDGRLFAAWFPTCLVPVTIITDFRAGGSHRQLGVPTRKKVSFKGLCRVLWLLRFSVGAVIGVKNEEQGVNSLKQLHQSKHKRVLLARLA